MKLIRVELRYWKAVRRYTSRQTRTQAAPGRQGGGPIEKYARIVVMQQRPMMHGVEAVLPMTAAQRRATPGNAH